MARLKQTAHTHQNPPPSSFESYLNKQALFATDEIIQKQECPICLDEFIKHELIVQLPCKHCYIIRASFNAFNII